MASGSQEGDGCALERRQEEEEAPEPDSHRVLVAELKKQMVTQLDGCHAEALSSSAAAGDSARSKINLLNILHQGWDLRSVCLSVWPAGRLAGWLFTPWAAAN